MHNNIKILLICIIILTGFLFAKHLHNVNHKLMTTISNKNEILNNLKTASKNIKKYQDYCVELDQNFKTYPVDKSVIIENLQKNKLLTNAEINVSISTSERIGPFELIAYQIESSKLTKGQLGSLVSTASKLSYCSPKISLSQGEYIYSDIEIYGLSPLQSPK